MLHRIVSPTVLVLAATAFLASCEDNTTGTPLTPPPASTAVYVNEVVPEGGYIIEERTVNANGVDTTVLAVSPTPVFEVLYPDGTPAVGQVVTFNLNLPGIITHTKDTVDAGGLVDPGTWYVTKTCPSQVEDDPFCRPVQTLIATPTSGNAGAVSVEATFPPEVPEPAARTARR